MEVLRNRGIILLLVLVLPTQVFSHTPSIDLFDGKLNYNAATAASPRYVPLFPKKVIPKKQFNSPVKNVSPKPKKIYVEPTLVEEALECGHDVRKSMESSWWQKIVNGCSSVTNTVLAFGKPVFEPVMYWSQRIKNYVYGKAFNFVYESINIIDEQMNGKPCSKKERQLRRESNFVVAQGALIFLTPTISLTHWFFSSKEATPQNNGVSKFSKEAKFLNFISNSLVETLVDTSGIKKQVIEGLTFYDKHDVAKKICTKFDSSGIAFKLYNTYGFIDSTYQRLSFIYKLIDNVTAVSSLAYQMTNHAKETGERTIPSKASMIIDILSRCADTYLAVVDHFNLKNGNGNDTTLQGLMRFFVEVTSLQRRQLVTIHKTKFPEKQQLSEEQLRELMQLLKHAKNGNLRKGLNVGGYQNGGYHGV